MLATMAPAESISVPSQSKTSNSNRLGIFRSQKNIQPRRKQRKSTSFPAFPPHPLRPLRSELFRRALGKKDLQLGRQRRLEPQPVAALRMHKCELPGMQEHALQALLGQALVQIEVAVLVVARYGKSKVRELHPK